MSETEPIPPTSSVTALRIPIIKKGEYDLWSMKMRQYIAITDHILWDIITNGNQTTTDPASPSVSAPKTSLAANARRNNEKALNILLSAIPDRHLLSFHDAVDARSLWKAIKARFGGNEASKKMQKNLLKQQFETFTIGSREELDSAYERFQHILSMLELHDATVSIEDANLKFLRSLPSVWHVVATMIRGQPGLDELDFDDLYNNLKVYEHELKGVSNSNSQNIAFLSTQGQYFETNPNHLIKDCNLHERTFQHTQTHKPKGTQGSRETRPVWNNIQRVNHSNFSRNSRYPHQRRSFIPSAVLTRDGLISTARPTITQTVPSKSTANVTYQGTARSRVPQAVLSRSTDGSYYPRLDNRRPRISSYSPSSRSSTTRTPHRPQRPKKIVKSIWVKKGSTVGSQAVLPQTVKKSAMINPKQTWKPKGNYLDSVNRGNGSYTLKQFEYGNPEEDLKDYAIIDSGCSGSMTGDKDKLSDFKEFKGGYVAFGNDSKGGRISGKGTIKTSCLDFEKVSYVEELKRLVHCQHQNIQQIGSSNLLGLPQRHSCLITLGGIRKGKQHRASCKKIEERTVREPLELLHMDLFGPVSVESINKKKIRHKLNDQPLIQEQSLKNQLMNEFSAKKDQDRSYGLSIDGKVPEERIQVWDTSTTSKGFRVSTGFKKSHGKKIMRFKEQVNNLVTILKFDQQESLAKAHNDDQKIAFEEEKRRISIAKGKDHVDSTFTLSTANTPPQSTGNTPTDLIDDTFKRFYFSTNSLMLRKRVRTLRKSLSAIAIENWVEAMQEELQTIQATRELKQSDSFGILHLQWALLSSMDVKSAFLVWQHHRRDLMQKDIKKEFQLVNSLSFWGIQVKQSNGGSISSPDREM
ncbi:hypothetical protein Tco_0792605 [Tanacetum coccineum]